MAMSTGGGGGAMSDINVTPLVDVMLVLLIIFMITAPLMSHTVVVTLPSTSEVKVDNNADNPPVDLAVKDDGSTYLNDSPVTEAELKAKFAVYASMAPQPELQVRGAKDTQWKVIRKILGEAKDAGMVHVGFMTTRPAGQVQE
jgi:biopolymer transport protein ExbD